MIPVRSNAFVPSALLLLVGGASACMGGLPDPSAIARAPEGMWASLNRPRPAPLPDAARISVSELVVLTDAWTGTAGVPPELGLQELVAAGLLRRRDVRYVERRRFLAAVDREDRGLPAPNGAPAVGVSPGAEYILTGTWARTGGEATLALRLVDAESGDVWASWRAATPIDADPTSVARRIVGSLLPQLAEMDRLPRWDDPRPSAAPAEFQESGVSIQAAHAFFRGLAAEERFDWEAARRGYQEAGERARGFFEADAALARVARLRAGGTLGANQP